MPGKVNPVIAEMTDMVSFQVCGFDATIAMAVQAGQMELNVMMPVINYNLLQSLLILTNSMDVLADKCVSGIEACEEVCRENARRGLGLATVLKPALGYEKASEIAKESVRTGKSIGEIAIEKGHLTQEELDAMLAREAEHPDGPQG